MRCLHSLGLRERRSRPASRPGAGTPCGPAVGSLLASGCNGFRGDVNPPRPAYGVQHGGTARRQPVADRKAFREAEVLEPAHPALERRLLEALPAGEILGAHAGMCVRSAPASPGSRARRDRAARAGRRSRPASCGESFSCARSARRGSGPARRNAMRYSLPSLRRPSSQRSAARSRKPASRASSSEMSSSAISATTSIASSPDRRAQPAAGRTLGRRQRRKATVISPAAIRSSTGLRNSIGAHLRTALMSATNTMSSHTHGEAPADASSTHGR